MVSRSWAAACSRTPTARRAGHRRDQPCRRISRHTADVEQSIRRLVRTAQRHGARTPLGRGTRRRIARGASLRCAAFGS